MEWPSDTFKELEFVVLILDYTDHILHQPKRQLYVEQRCKEKNIVKPGNIWGKYCKMLDKKELGKYQKKRSKYRRRRLKTRYKRTRKKK